MRIGPGPDGAQSKLTGVDPFDHAATSHCNGAVNQRKLNKLFWQTAPAATGNLPEPALQKGAPLSFVRRRCQSSNPVTLGSHNMMPGKAMHSSKPINWIAMNGYMAR